MITYTEEPLSHCQADIESLLPEQWAETGDFGIECMPNWPFYVGLERAKALLLIMARDDVGVAVGYLAGMIHPHPNSVGSVVASIPTFFIANRPGRPLFVRSLLSHGVKLALQRGAVKVTVETDYDNSVGRVLIAMGAVPKAVKFVIMRKVEERAHA